MIKLILLIVDTTSRNQERNSFSLPTFSLSEGFNSPIKRVSLILHCKSDFPVVRISKWSHLMLWPVEMTWSAKAEAWQPCLGLWIVLLCLCFKTSLRASSYEPGNRAGSVTRTNSVVCSYGKFQPGRPGWIQETQPKWWNINLYYSRLSELCGPL